MICTQNGILTRFLFAKLLWLTNLQMNATSWRLVVNIRSDHPPTPPRLVPRGLFPAVTAWLQDLEAGPIKSFSFSKVPPSQPASPGSSVTDLFSAPDFVVGSTTGNIVAVNCHTFEHPSSDQPSHRLLAQVLAAILIILLQLLILLLTPAISLWLHLILSQNLSVQHAEPSGCCQL